MKDRILGKMSDRIRRFLRKSSRGEGGFTLIEVLVALAIISIIAVGIYSALGTSLISTADERERATAKNLAEAQMEYVKQLHLDPDVDVPPPEGLGVYEPDEEIMSQYGGFVVTIDAADADAGVPPGDEAERDDSLQLITITVRLGGEEVWVLEGYKLITNATYS